VENTSIEAAGSKSAWRPAQAYTMAVVCLLIGLPTGYLIRGSAQPVPNPAIVSAPAGASVPKTAQTAPPSMPTLDDMKRMAKKQAEPLMAELEKKPNDAVLLNKVALTYKAAHQFDQAAAYFKKSLDADPANIAVRDDYASCLYYLGDVEGALTQLDKSLSYDPKHMGTLYNIGMIKWKGKGDVEGAVASWKKLLQLNPKPEQKQAIQRLIEEATRSKDATTSADKS
jgi:cytochrome c-type biogenesis protein CcmH/NrfG